VDIKGFREAGYEPDALVNYLALLGWNPGSNIEHMSMSEMVDLFSIERVNNSGAMFDLKKLDSFNAHYLRNRHPDDILMRMTSMPEGFLFGLNDDKMDLIAKMAVERAVFSKDLKDAMDYLWNIPDLSGEIKMKNVDEFVRIMSVFVDDNIMAEIDSSDWTCEHIRKELEFICNNIGVPIGKIMPILRVALTGGVPGPQLPEIMYIIGIEETKNRINAMLSKIQELA
jgi:glutamyl/glutaminyl-tRNA synthetase